MDKKFMSMPISLKFMKNCLKKNLKEKEEFVTKFSIFF